MFNINLYMRTEFNNLIAVNVNKNTMKCKDILSSPISYDNENKNENKKIIEDMQSGFSEICNIQVCSDQEEIDIGLGSKEGFAKRIEDMIKEYSDESKDMLTKSSYEAKITLTSDAPTFCTPRRLSLKKKMR